MNKVSKILIENTMLLLYKDKIIRNLIEKFPMRDENLLKIILFKQFH
jgi:hypothetical protein